MVILSPIIKLDAKETFDVMRAIPLDLVTVRLQDLVLRKTFRFSKTYDKIVSAGGLHDFLDFRGKILLSLIMKDQIVAKFKPKRYAKAINSLRPDYFTTIDGETYEGEYSESLIELRRIHAENIEILKLCSRFTPIGLVKGCSEYQIELHVDLLESLGVNDFVFHVGDFFRHGEPDMIRKAKVYSQRIRRHARTLVLYGMGSQKRLLEFSFADVYVSFSHFVTARNGMMFVGSKKVKYQGKYDSRIVIGNFVEMHKNVKALDFQTRLIGGNMGSGWRNKRKEA